MVKIGTSCSKCCFFTDNTKCEHGLHEVFLDRGAEIFSDESGVEIDRICQYRRGNDWQNEKTLSDRISICKDEIYIKGTILLISDNKSDLENTIDKLNKLPRIENFKFVILYTNIKSKELLEVCGNKIKSEYKLIINTASDLNLAIYRSIKYAKNGYLFILDSKKEFIDNIIDKVNSFVNKKMYRLLHIEPTDKYHQSVSMVHLYKYVKGDMGISFSEKLKNISIEENSDAQVFSWGEINAEYID